jgi:tRNA G10  N-methylase Trm11
MNKYFFILGRNPALSLAEIISYLDLQETKYSLVFASNESALVEMDTDLDCSLTMSKLGGTVKIGKIINEAGLDENEKNFEEILSADNLLKNYFSKKSGKMHFGISIYSGEGDVRLVNLMAKKLMDMNMMIKRNLRETGISSGFVRIKERNISSVSVSKNRLLRSGAEIIMIVATDKVFVGSTYAIQEFASFGYRDMAKPNKDKRSGIMPPKLARMMINLSKVKSNSVLLDPFCGSGTVISEAVILGIKKIIGTDIKIQAIEDSRKNIDWMFEKFTPQNIKYKKEEYNINIFQSDAVALSDKIGKDYIDALVTEPYLGPPLFSKPNLSLINKIFSEISNLYISSFRQFKKIIKIGGRIVIVFPSFKYEEKMYYLEIISQIEKEGFEKKKFFTQEIISRSKIDMSERETILYASNDQNLIREIVFFTRIK